MKKKAVEITSLPFDEYGTLYDMNDPAKGTGLVNQDSGDGWRDANTRIPVIDTQASLGCTWGSGTPFTAAEMERHAHTQEALFCAGEPIVFMVAKAGGSAPKACDVTPVILRPGQVAVLHRGVWHSAAHGLNDPAQYYYLALCYKNEPTEWAEIEGEPVEVAFRKQMGS